MPEKNINNLMAQEYNQPAVEKITVKQQLRDCIERNIPFRWRNIEIFRLTIQEEVIDSIHYRFLVTSNFTEDLEPLQESAALIHSGHSLKFDTDFLYNILKENELYFTSPLKKIAENMHKSEYLQQYLKSERSKKIYSYLTLNQ